MIHRGLARIAVAASAVLVGAVIAATPAAATDAGGRPGPGPAPGFGLVPLNLPTAPLKAKDFSHKGCDGIGDGAKVGTDGWLFDQPVTGAQDYGYIFVLTYGDQQEVVLGVSKKGAVGLEFEAPQLNGLKAGKLSSGKAKSLATAAKEGDPSGGLKEIPAPEGVAGGLTPTGEAWLQTPAGWQLEGGLLLYMGGVEDAPQEFSLLRVCDPKAAVTPTPTATPTPAVTPSNAPGVGGGSGESLPVTGTNVAVLSGAGVLLVGVGAALFVMRRRRDTTKFVA